MKTITIFSIPVLMITVSCASLHNNEWLPRTPYQNIVNKYGVPIQSFADSIGECYNILDRSDFEYLASRNIRQLSSREAVIKYMAFYLDSTSFYENIKHKNASKIVGFEGFIVESWPELLHRMSMFDIYAYNYSDSIENKRSAVTRKGMTSIIENELPQIDSINCYMPSVDTYAVGICYVRDEIGEKFELHKLLFRVMKTGCFVLDEDKLLLSTPWSFFYPVVK